jgi:hypothetical protein
VDIARSEMAEASLESFISKRHSERVKDEGERAREEQWQKSVRDFNARQSDEQRLLRLHYHEGQARRLSNTLGSLIRYHEAEAEKYRNGHDHKEQSA